MWGAFVREELRTLAGLLEREGFTLDEEQPHTSGERFLMTREKLVLLGMRTADGRRVVIKVSRHPAGHAEIRREKEVLDTLQRVAFASGAILLPSEVYFSTLSGYLVWVSEFIEQDEVFAARPIEEQFFMALDAFETQEGFHANTFENLRSISGVFPIATAKTYLESFSKFKDTVAQTLNVVAVFARAERELHAHVHTLERYSGYLTHTDFAPANTRVQGRNMYLIDLSSVSFGNKYEGWARFINWALLHSPELERFLLEYVRKNRGAEEYLCLRLMRLYKAGLLAGYYAETLPKTAGDLRLLTEERIGLWRSVMEALLADTPVPTVTLDDYRHKRNALRSPEETERQKEFNIPAV
ncbi:MAG: hypothetical protein Q7S95_03860 [bacterium]|nr:hypothetical protein [bacterium]